MTQRREHIKAPYLTHNNAVLNERQCKDYNDIQDDINRWIDAGRKVPEWLLDYSFKTFNIMCEVSKRSDDNAKNRR